MTNKIILIDAAHREETRVAVLDDGILQDFDREAIAIKQIKGNIYLAKVTRVEQSLQAAFVDYGSDKHGFLPFGDIHPNYFQISEEERQNLLKASDKSNDHSEEELEENQSNRNDRNDRNEDDEKPLSNQSYSVEDETDSYKGNIYSIHKRYNIQDVIKPGQLILVQCSKDERGNKGASMTTYISIAGKYSVLMANTPNKGGVSKKVENFRDRKLLRSILQEMNVPSDRSVIIRTAGVGKRPEEINRDYEYLAKLWDKIQELSKTSKAPTFIHAEDDIIKKCIRDIYNDNIKEVIVEGKESFDAVMDFAKLTATTNVNNIKLYDDRVPIFNKYRVEQQISALYEKQITLPSGGSIVIDHTEALVAIDVNSGRATKESNVEETAYRTNIEAAKEIAKQLRLRDLAGLVVIDFIDMYDQKNRRNVERTLRDELQFDRARIQLGRISAFGLLEMSRQRLGVSFFETITEPCKHCNGTGFVRSAEILAVSILRAIRRACSDDQTGVIYIYTNPETIAYMMNFKKGEIATTEKNYNVHIFMHNADDVGGNGFNIKKRKKLSEEEKREIEMHIATGKVNELGLEKEYMNDSKDYDHYDDDRQNRKPNHKNRNHNKKNHRNNKRRHQKESHTKKKGLIDSVFSVFK